MDDWDDGLLSQAAYVVRALESGPKCFRAATWRAAIEALAVRGTVRAKESAGVIHVRRAGQWR
jgi:hypothetical protein